MRTIIEDVYVSPAGSLCGPIPAALPLLNLSWNMYFNNKYEKFI